jgi:hypothetical protein
LNKLEEKPLANEFNWDCSSIVEYLVDIEGVVGA